MALTLAQQQNIIRAVVGMFNAAPGVVYLNLLGNYNDLPGAGNNTIANLYVDLANSPAFASLGFAFSNASSNDQFAAAFVNQVFTGAVVTQANTQAAISYVTGLLNTGTSRGLAMKTALDLLANASPTDPAYGDAQLTFVNKIAVASEYTTVFGGNATSVSELQAVVAGVTSLPPGARLANDPPLTGLRYSMTTDVDTILGSDGNDIIIADNSGGNKQLSTADSINGNGGIDTLKVFLAPGDNAIGAPATLTSIERLYISGGVISAYTVPATISTLLIDAPAGTVAAPVYTLSGQTIVLSNSNNQMPVIFGFASATDTAENITVNNVNAGVNPAWTGTIDISGPKVTQVTLTANVANSAFLLSNSGTSVTTVNLAGDRNLTVTVDSALARGISEVNSSTATGAINLDMKSATTIAKFTFKGGAGNDTITFANDEFTVLSTGTQLDGGARSGDKIGLFDSVLTAAEIGKINTTTGFEILGLNTGIVLDAGLLTSIKQFSIDAPALTIAINAMPSGNQITLNRPVSGLTVATAPGVADTRIVYGGAASTGLAITDLNVIGVTSVAIVSNGTSPNSVTNPILSSDNTAFNISGAGDFSLKLGNGTLVGSRIDGSAMTGKLTASGGNLASSGDVIIGGSGTDTLDGGKGADTLTGGAGADIFAFSGAAGANSSGAVFGQPDVITDFVRGVDKLQFTGVTELASSQQVAVQAAVAALPVDATEIQIATAMATANTTSLGVSFAAFGGNTYALFEFTGIATGYAPDDIFIKLVGVTTLPTFANDVTP